MKNTVLRNFLASAVLATCVFAPAQATPLTWTLDNVTFDDGTAATGSFVYDADSGLVSNFNVSVQDGTLPAFTYSNSTAFASYGDLPSTFTDYNISFNANDFSRSLFLAFTSDLTDSGGVVGLNFNIPPGQYGNYECDNCFAARFITSGSVSAEAVNDVPEPASLALLGLGALGMTALRRKAKA